MSSAMQDRGAGWTEWPLVEDIPERVVWGVWCCLPIPRPLSKVVHPSWRAHTHRWRCLLLTNPLVRVGNPPDPHLGPTAKPR